MHLRHPCGERTVGELSHMEAGQQVEPVELCVLKKSSVTGGMQIFDLTLYLLT